MISAVRVVETAGGPEPVALPPVAWIGAHPTIAEPQAGGRLRRCVRCNLRDGWYGARCEPGLIVHLIDPADVHAAPEVFDGVIWAEPDAINGAHRVWADKGFRVTRKPDGATGESVHPRYRPCPQCNEDAMREGTLTPVHLERPLPPPRPRGRAAWARR